MMQKRHIIMIFVIFSTPFCKPWATMNMHTDTVMTIQKIWRTGLAVSSPKKDDTAALSRPLMSPMIEE